MLTAVRMQEVPVGLQFWPSTFEIPAMLPAPKAWACPAKRKRTASPMKRGDILKEDMAICVLLEFRMMVSYAWTQQEQRGVV